MAERTVILVGNSSARTHSQNASSMLSAATQLFLLIIGRSAHSILQSLIHASMIRLCRMLWLNCYIVTIHSSPPDIRISRCFAALPALSRLKSSLGEEFRLHSRNYSKNKRASYVQARRISSVFRIDCE